MASLKTLAGHSAPKGSACFAFSIQEQVHGKHHTGTVATKPIEAFFQPQAWINDYATDIDEGYCIDVTQKVLSLQLNQIHTLEDYRGSTDALVDAVKLGHHGPYTIAVVSSVLEFFGVQSLDQNISRAA